MSRHLRMPFSNWRELCSARASQPVGDVRSELPRDLGASAELAAQRAQAGSPSEPAQSASTAAGLLRESAAPWSDSEFLGAGVPVPIFEVEADTVWVLPDPWPVGHVSSIRARGAAADEAPPSTAEARSPPMRTMAIEAVCSPPLHSASLPRTPAVDASTRRRPRPAAPAGHRPKVPLHPPPVPMSARRPCRPTTPLGRDAAQQTELPEPCGAEQEAHFTSTRSMDQSCSAASEASPAPSCEPLQALRPDSARSRQMAHASGPAVSAVRRLCMTKGARPDSKLMSHLVQRHRERIFGAVC